MVKLLGHLGGKLNRNLVTGNRCSRFSRRHCDAWKTPRLHAVWLMAGPLFFSHLGVSSEETMKKFVAWDSEKRLSFAVPFADMKPVIYLDPFLPHISELALSASDRQTKVGPR